MKRKCSTLVDMAGASSNPVPDLTTPSPSGHAWYLMAARNAAWGLEPKHD